MAPALYFSRDFRQWYWKRSNNHFIAWKQIASIALLSLSVRLQNGNQKNLRNQKNDGPL